MSHARAIVHRLMQIHVERHADVLEEHKKKGPAFAAAVEELQRPFRAPNFIPEDPDPNPFTN
jgi:hypothetical protein